MLKKLSVMLLALVVIGFALPEVANAANSVQLPNWANAGNLEQDLSSKGQKIAKIISAVVGILGVIGMLVGAACFPLNKPDMGKQFVVYAGIGLIIAGSVYGIAALFI